MPPRKIKVVDVINDTEDIPQHTEVEVKAIENTDTIDEEQPAIENDVKAITNTDTIDEEKPAIENDTQLDEPETNEKPPTNIKTVEMVECPDCNKKMTKKSLKYSHAKNCIANKQPKEAEAKEEETTEEETKEEEEMIGEEVKQPPKLKRTVSVKGSKAPHPVKKTTNKVKPEQPQQPQQPLEITPTITNIYGREHRNERVKQKTHKMNTLFVNAIQKS